MYSGKKQGLSPAYPDRAAWGTAQKLRVWQSEALEKYFSKADREDFLTVATPGAGKTTFALRIAGDLLAQGVINRITIVAPTEHLKRQWADAASRVGISIDPNFRNSAGQHGAAYIGVAVTYAQVASKPMLHRAKTAAAKTLVILDEIHHAGDSLSWGDAVLEAFDVAVRRLALTGTPFRSDSSQIPFVRYTEAKDGSLVSAADYVYGYGDALDDNVVRPVIFMTYSGSMKWRTKAGYEISANLGDSSVTRDVASGAWRSALDPDGEWIPTVLRAADKRLSQVRSSMPDAGGLVVATDHKSARAYARELFRITGENPVVVLSDDSGSSDQIESFAGGDFRWMVAVRMVSEGVDIPRLAVGVYATATSTALFFAQLVGRFVRARRRGETASIFLPSVPVLLNLANQLEIERDHIISKRDSEMDFSLSEQVVDYSGDDLLEQHVGVGGDLVGAGFEVLESSVAFDRVLFDGGEFGLGGGDVEEQNFLGIPGLLEPHQVTHVLRQRQGSSGFQGLVSDGSVVSSDFVDHRAVRRLRKELSGLVSAWSRRSGKPHALVHSELRKVCGGPAVAQASVGQLEERVARLRGWFVGRR